MNTTSLSRVLLAATVLAGAALTSAAARPERLPASFVTLSVQEDGTGQTRTTTLGCHPVGGAHPRAEQACESLTAAKGDFDALKPESAQCPLIYKPVRVTARGVWRNEPLNFTASFSNDCAAKAGTDGVFDF